MILLPTNRRVIRPYDKPSFEHTQRYGLIKGHWANMNCVARWLFNEDSGGQVIDLSGNGITGTFNGDIIWSPGKFGPAPDFPGVDNYITAVTPPGLVDITYVVWFKSDVGNADAGGYLIRVEDTAISMDYGDITWRPNVNTTAVDCSYTILAGVWYQIVVTQTGTSYAIYVNGILVQSGTTAALDLVSSFNVNIGNYNTAGGIGDWDGQIDVPSIYNRVLSASEVAELCWNPFIGIEKRTAPIYFFVPTDGVVKELAGTSAIECTATGELKATKELIGTTAISCITAGELSKAAEKILTGTTAISSTTSGVIKATREILGTVAISSTVTGDLVSPTRAFAGTVTIASTTSGAIKFTQELIGTVAIESTTTGELTKTGIKEIAGTTVISSATSGELRATRELTGVVAIESTTSGDLSVPQGGLSDYAENGVLELITGKTPFTKPTVYVGFCTADPGEEATGADCNEVADTNGYERAAADNWNSASSGAIDNAAAFATPCATGSWGEITHYVLVDSEIYGEGNVLVYDKLDTARAIDERDNLVFAAGELCLTLD